MAKPTFNELKVEPVPVKLDAPQGALAALAVGAVLGGAVAAGGPLALLGLLSATLLASCRRIVRVPILGGNSMALQIQLLAK